MNSIKIEDNYLQCNEMSDDDNYLIEVIPVEDEASEDEIKDYLSDEDALSDTSRTDNCTAFNEEEMLNDAMKFECANLNCSNSLFEFGFISFDLILRKSINLGLTILLPVLAPAGLMMKTIMEIFRMIHLKRSNP